MAFRSWSEEFKTQSIKRMQENIPRIAKCFNQLSEEEIWARPNNSLSSPANLVLHLCGNIRQYIVSSLGGREDTRQRDQEFVATEGFSKAELLEKLEKTVQEACEIIERASEEELLKNRQVQGFELTGIGIIIHVTEHYSYHTGQIAFWTKYLRHTDLGFYAGKDLNIKNED